jgi:hypothetical protein
LSLTLSLRQHEANGLSLSGMSSPVAIRANDLAFIDLFQDRRPGAMADLAADVEQLVALGVELEHDRVVLSLVLVDTRMCFEELEQVAEAFERECAISHRRLVDVFPAVRDVVLVVVPSTTGSTIGVSLSTLLPATVEVFDGLIQLAARTTDRWFVVL